MRFFAYKMAIFVVFVRQKSHQSGEYSINLLMNIVFTGLVRQHRTIGNYAGFVQNDKIMYDDFYNKVQDYHSWLNTFHWNCAAFYQRIKSVIDIDTMLLLSQKSQELEKICQQIIIQIHLHFNGKQFF